MKRKGFTLIELLAVIVILAVIALIAVPIILNIVSQSKKSAFLDSVYGLIESTKLFYTEGILDGDTKDQVFEFGDDKQNNLKYSGSAPKGGSIVLTSTGEIEVAIHNNEWCATKGVSESKVMLVKYEDGKCEVTDIPKVIVADTTGANKPNLKGLVPIKWNGTTWVKADENNVAGENQWYDYSSQMWANAASVAEEYRNVGVGEEIPESAINAYFVWIPRYEYDYTNLGNFYAGGTAELPGEIKVNFVSKSKTTPTTNYKIHPAFTFGGAELSGIWVGKFETSASPDSACFTGPSEGNCNNANQIPYIKPNVNSLRYMQISNMFLTSQKLSASGNSYGIDDSADAHMMKNSEWGAVAYLSQSKYGKYGNSSYSGADKEVYINNYWNNNTLTGCSAGVASVVEVNSCAYTYEKNIGGTGASTTGTIYGVYDMSGGAMEYTMGYYTEASSTWGSTSTINYAGFSTAPEEKYYDAYGTESSETACNSGICYGHALSETKLWYGDFDYFFTSYRPWLVRGGCYDNTMNSGIFSSYYYVGGIYYFVSFRVAMIG